jgi:hypothetical protein
MTPKNGRVTGTTTPGERRGFRLAINRDDAREEAREFVRQRARIGALGVELIGDGEVDLENAHLQDVAQRRAIDKDRPGFETSPDASLRLPTTLLTPYSILIRARVTTSFHFLISDLRFAA